MSFFDWVEMGKGARGEEFENFKGSFSVTIGDALAGTFGANHSHTFGPSVSLVCDPEDFLFSKLDHFLPLASGLIAGVGGSASFVYGSNTSATYVGPQMDIRRGKSISKTSDNVFAMKTPDDIDWPTSLAAAALSALICATAAAFELAIHFAYPKFGSSSSEDQEEIEHYGTLPELLKTMCYTITSRLMALLKTLEEKGTWANFAKQFVKEGALCTMLSTVILTAVFPPAGLVLAFAAALAYCAKGAISDGTNAAT